MVQPQLEAIHLALSEGTGATSQVRRFLERGKADLIRGHTSKSTSHLITNIEKQDIQDCMGENNVMHNPDGRKASQWCFVQEDSIACFGREIRGKIHVEITPSLHNQGEDGSTSA